MKRMNNKEKVQLHSSWHDELSPKHISYATLDAFISDDMYMHITTMRECLFPEPRPEEPMQCSYIGLITHDR